jgi:hypothetical protein
MSLFPPFLLCQSGRANVAVNSVFNLLIQAGMYGNSFHVKLGTGTLDASFFFFKMLVALFLVPLKSQEEKE